jgi:signal transduction histidine kinase
LIQKKGMSENPSNPESVSEPEENLESLQQQLKELKKAKSEAESASHAKSEFLANMSHDLRTPLHAILSYSRFGIEKIDRIDKEKTTKYFKRIEESGKKLEEMLGKIVDLSKLEIGKMAFQMHNCNLSLIIQSLEKDYKSKLEEKKLKLQTRITSDISMVTCDQNLIARAMRIIMDNALCNSIDEREVAISLEKCIPDLKKNLPHMKVTFSHRQSEALPEEILEHFEGYINRIIGKPKERENGIDLAIVCRIIKLHEGHLWAENEDSGLVSYSFALPANIN